MGTRDAVLNAFRSAPDRPLSLGQIANLSGVSYGDYSRLLAAVQRLRAAGLVERVERGIYRLTRPEEVIGG